jgi:hypothetical protein
MTDAFADFRWPVYEYEWQDWLDESGRLLLVPSKGLASSESASGLELLWNRAQKSEKKYGPVLCPIVKDALQAPSYRPMDRNHAALFREFADLDYQNTDSILKFAHRYGTLGLVAQNQSIKVPVPSTPRGGFRWHHAFGEPYLQWAIEICFMREGLRYSERKPRNMEEWKRLKWLFDRNLQHVQGRLGFTPTKEPRVLLEPLTLISAMWLQLALAITGEKEFVACKFCRRLFEISTEQTGYRRHREFCSVSCKTKDYRKRKRTALRLAKSGDRVRDIATKTSTDTSTVRSWLASAKRDRDSKAGDA